MSTQGASGDGALLYVLMGCLVATLGDLFHEPCILGCTRVRLQRAECAPATVQALLLSCTLAMECPVLTLLQYGPTQLLCDVRY